MLIFAETLQWRENFCFPLLCGSLIDIDGGVSPGLISGLRPYAATSVGPLQLKSALVLTGSQN